LNTKPFSILINLSCAISDQSSATINHNRTYQCPIYWYGPYYFTSFQRPFFSLALTFYLLFAEETLVNQPVGSSSPQAETSVSLRIQSSPSQVEAPVSPGMNPSSPQPEASNLPGTPPGSPQLEASALPGTPQAPPQLVIQELPLEPEQIPSPIQEARNEVSMGIQLCYFPSINHP
jgi:hypothetical protein